MERKITSELMLWKNNPRRKPLIISGARQVGKTYTALTFGKEHYKNTVYFSMEDSSEVQAIFDRDLKPERIIRELSAHTSWLSEVNQKQLSTGFNILDVHIFTI